MAKQVSTQETWLGTQLQSERRAVLIVVCVGLALVLLNIAQAYEIALLLTQLVLDSIDPWHYQIGLALLGGIVIIKASLNYLQHHLRFMIGQRLKVKIRQDLIHHLTQVSPITLKNFSAGDLSTTFQEKIEALHPYLSHYYPQSLLCALSPCLILIFVFPLNWIAAFILLITAPLIPLMMALIGLKSKQMSLQQMGSLSKMGSHFLNCIQGLGTLKLYNQAEPEIAHIQNTAASFREATLKVLAVAFLSSTVLEFFSAAALALLAAFLGFSLLGELHLGPALNYSTAFFILLLAPDFYQPLRELARAYHAKADALAAAQELEKLYTLPTLSCIQTSALITPKPLIFSAPPSIDFQDLSYQYPNRSSPALNSIHLKIHSGEHFAFTGHSGAGKSTLVQCLLRFIQPTQGQILINQTELNTIPFSDWHAQLAWISQKTDLFPGTLYDNLLLAHPAASPQDCLAILDQVQMKSFVQALPQGLNTRIAEQHIGLSGGQARRLAIARAFLKNAPILVMDEPTASLDPHTAKEVLEALNVLCTNKTVITISHRLETLKQADRIGILQAGRLVTVDSFDSLQQQGYFSDYE